MSELEHGTTNDVFWSNVEHLMRRGTDRAAAVKAAASLLREDCAAAGVEVPELDRIDEQALLPTNDTGEELTLDDSDFNAMTRKLLRTIK